MTTLPRKVVLRVPASTANMGPAYDCLGMALSIFLEVTVEHADVFFVSMEGEGNEEVSKDADNMVVKACRLGFEHANKEMPVLKFTIKSGIPYGCGCGSSSAAAVAGFVAGMCLCGNAVATEGMDDSRAQLHAITRFEGHPDNAAAVLYGGVQLCCSVQDGQVITSRVPTPPGLSVVLFLPRNKMKADTHATRGLIPGVVSLEDAVYNISRASLLVLALSTNNLELLRCCGDRLHEGRRADALFPHFHACVDAARKAGASYAFLSGAGPAVCAFVDACSSEVLPRTGERLVVDRVAEAMVEAASTAGVPGRAVITQPCSQGVQIVSIDPAHP
uniref:Putative homoserine kinase n=1 Tax=Trypanosoma congolense (strain IL3000) TaxID=1068625 RepID=G0UP19_TRYCI|nr:putative homoserine kinase [Trypanosoma congolense IL3000]